jgi:8-oxo-dGTP pyrophosphatase MutT (NUDIX family)
LILEDDADFNGLSTDDIEILMIQRRDSIGFIELIRAKYKLTDIDYIKEQVEGTTVEERQKLVSSPFEDLWVGLWGQTTFETKQYKQEYDQAKYKFEQLLKGIEIDGTFISLQLLINSVETKWSTPEWGFPKGRRNMLEKDVQCAVREFCEETGLTENQFTLFKNIHPIHETFYGNNNIHYCHVYYLAWIHPSIKVQFNKENEVMIKEIGDIQWLSKENALLHIRQTNTNKREILLRAYSIIENISILIQSPIALQKTKKEEEHQNRNEYGQFGGRGHSQWKSDSDEKRTTFNFVED